MLNTSSIDLVKIYILDAKNCFLLLIRLDLPPLKSLEIKFRGVPQMSEEKENFKHFSFFVLDTFQSNMYLPPNQLL